MKQNQRYLIVRVSIATLLIVVVGNEKEPNALVLWNTKNSCCEYGNEPWGSIKCGEFAKC